MPLNLEQPGSHQFIRSVTSEGIRVGEEWLRQSFILTPDQVHREWPVAQPEDLNEQCLETLLALQPELVVLGTGARQVFPAPVLLAPFLRQGIGVEVMSTDAACRTFNICVTENRRVVAGIILPAV